MPEDSRARSARAGIGLTDLAEGRSTIPRGRTRSLRGENCRIKRESPRPSEEEKSAAFRGRNRRFPRENRAESAVSEGKSGQKRRFPRENGDFPIVNPRRLCTVCLGSCAGPESSSSHIYRETRDGRQEEDQEIRQEVRQEVGKTAGRQEGRQEVREEAHAERGVHEAQCSPTARSLRWWAARRCLGRR